MTQPPNAPREAPARSQFLALFTAVMLPMFLGAVDQTLLATATPRIAAELGGLSDTSWIAVGYLLAATVAAPLYGRLGDRFGRRPAMLASLGVFALGSLACAVSQTLLALIAARTLQGLGGGGLMVLSQALIGELVAPHHRPRYQGYFALVFTASSVGGPLIGGLVVNHADWRWLFIGNLPLCALAAWRVSRLPSTPTAPEMRNAPLDPAGVALFAVAAIAALLWLSVGGHHFRWISAPSAALLGVALVCTAFLLRQQRRHPAPFLPLDVLRLPGVPWICVSVLCFAGSLFALIFLLPIYVQLGHGASAASSGMQLVPLTGGLVLGSTLNSRITLHTGIPARMPPYGLGLAAVVMLALSVAPPSAAATSAAALVCGLGFGTVMPSAQLTTQVLAGPARLGASAALLSLTRSFGAASGTAAFGGLMFALLHAPAADAGAGRLVSLDGFSPAQVTRAFEVVFATLAGFLAFGAWAATRVPHVHLGSGAALRASAAAD
jgi:MFS family permease